MPWSEGVLSTSTTSGGSRQLVRRQAQKIRERRILYLDARGPHRLCRPIGSKARRALSLLLYLGVRRGDLVKLVPKEPARHQTQQGRQAHPRQDPSASERLDKAAAAGARRDHRRKPSRERNVLGDFTR